MSNTQIRYNDTLKSIAWPIARLGEAIALLAYRSQLIPELITLPKLPPDMVQKNDNQLEIWFKIAADQLELTIKSITTPYNQVEQFMKSMGPAIIRLPLDFDENQQYFLLVLNSGRRISVIAPDFTNKQVSSDLIRSVLCHPLESPLLTQVEQTLKETGIPQRRWKKTQRTILRHTLGPYPVGDCWLLDLPPGKNMWGQIRQIGILKNIFSIISMYLIEYLLLILGWWIIGRISLLGQLKPVWLVAWGLLMFSIIPFQLWGLWSQNQFSTRTGILLKQRLIYGVLQLNPEEIRHQGAGHFFGRVIESEVIELVAITGGLTTVLSLIQIVIATVILSIGSNSLLHALLLIIWVIFMLLLSLRYLQHNQTWIKFYREMSNDLIERMVGHRTRLVQEDKTHWHKEEDHILNNYLHLSEKLDSVGVQLDGLVLRGWFLVGLSGIIYQFMFGLSSTETLIISLAGILFASQALAGAVIGIRGIIDALLAWQEVKPIYHAAARPYGKQKPDLDISTLKEQYIADEGQMLVANRLNFRYPNRLQPILKKCMLKINMGDRLLLQGPSGSGKSTLVALLSGLRQADSGLLLLNGLDQSIVGLDEWRRKIVVVPQFHENHVLTASLAFNLLMGRNWPPTPQDLREAETICQEIGLGDLLERMPAGLYQIVGDSGWQLSHGERSRLYIARALLQKPDLVVLDENFSTLDPENLQRSFACVLKHSPTLLVIAHP